MRTTGVLLAGAALVLLPAGPGAGRAAAQEAQRGVVAPVVTAVATGEPQSVALAGQAASPTDHHRYRDGRYRHGDRYDEDGYCYGCAGQGSYCDASGCYHRHPYYGDPYYGDPYYGDPYGPGGHRGGYGCSYDYRCGPPYHD